MLLFDVANVGKSTIGELLAKNWMHLLIDLQICGKGEQNG